jgi:hypothetical protein
MTELYNSSLFLEHLCVHMTCRDPPSQALHTGCATCILEERVADEAAARDTLYTTLRYTHPGNLALRSEIADVRRLEGDRMHALVRARPDASLPRKVEREHMCSGPHLFN